MALSPHFPGIEDIRFHVVPTPEISEDVWRELQLLEFHSLSTVLTRNEQEIATAVKYGDLPAYIEARQNPASLVGDAYRADLSYADPLTALAISPQKTYRRVVGVAFGANNASGPDEASRQARLQARLPRKNWNWYQMVAVEPNYMSQGIATALLASIASRRRLLQPTSAYAWRTPGIDRVLSNLGMRPKGNPEADFPFGKDAEPIQVQRYTGSVALLRARYARMGGGRQILKHVRRSYDSYAT